MPNYIETTTITLEAALGAVHAAIQEGARAGVRVVVTVVDPGMAPVAFARTDGATPHSAETSLRKAKTAASTRKATGWMPADLAVALPSGTGNLLTNILGGFPLTFGGKHVGGIGIAGGTPEQDAQVARATLAAIGADGV